MRLLKYLNEMSYSDKDIPDDFWVVFDLENMVDELKTGKIKGLKGISSDSKIKFSFLGVARDAMLKIPSKELLKQNKITRIMYENPHYLVSNNLWALRRLYNASKKMWVDQVFGNLFERIKSKIKNKQLKYDMDYYGFRSVDYTWSKQIEPKLKIKNIKQLSMLTKTYIEDIFSKKTGREYSVLIGEIESAVFNALSEIGKIYSSENEWVIKNEYMIVPKSSTLYVLRADIKNYNQEVYDAIADNIDTGHFELIMIATKIQKDVDLSAYKNTIKIDKFIEKLNNRYKVEYISISEFKRKQKEHWENGE